MSSASELLLIGTEDPVYYAELLKEIPSHIDRRLPFDERSCSRIPGVRGVGDTLSRRLQTILDDIATISLCEKGNVSATVVSLKNGSGSLEARLYIVFNHQEDEAPSRCDQHLRSIFMMLREVPCKPSTSDGSQKLIANDLEEYLVEICRVIHNYSFGIFADHVNKRRLEIPGISKSIAQDRTYFTLEQRSTLLKFMMHVDLILKTVDQAQATKQLSATKIKMLISIYSSWTEHKLLPENTLTDNRVTLLNEADTFLAQRGVRFQLRRWAMKIMSFVISSNRLFSLTQSHRLRGLLEGSFSVQILSSPTTRPYRCDLSPGTIQVVLDAVLAETSYLDADWEEDRNSFIELWSKESEVTRQKPRVHAELAMIIAMEEGKIKHLPYIGTSKLSCIMCSHYICVFKKIMGGKIATRGSHKKAYPGWFWPTHPDPGLDAALRQAFLNSIRGQLRSDFEQTSIRRKSDSSVDSGGARLRLGRNDEEILHLFNE